jgi:hypothetical protein
MITPTPTELEIITILRENKPHEVLEIIKDQLGRPDSYIVKRQQKIILRENKK